MNTKLNNQPAKKWFYKCIITLVSLLVFIAAVMIIIDPYFHYHKPLSFLSYRLHEQRYINDGISRHFDYDAMITGSSMTENFKPSEMDALFGTNAVKTSFSGAGYQELSQHVERSLKRNDSLHTVLWALDYNGFIREYDWKNYQDYPTYLYDDNIFNDAAYLFNKSIFYHGVLPCIERTLSGTPSTSRDEYSSWEFETGLDAVMNTHDRDIGSGTPIPFTQEEREMVTRTITENITKLTNKYPDVTFYLYYTPFSITYWESLKLDGLIERQFVAEQLVTELLLECPNVKLYNFFDQHDIICNLDYYSDSGHHNAEVNSYILQWISNDTSLVTKDNYLDKLQQEKDFYLNYDYDSIYVGSSYE